VRFQFIAVERAHHSLCLLCRCMRVTRSGFYAWVTRAPSARATRDAELRGLVQASFDASDGRYGRPRILRDIKAKAGRVSRKRVIRLMQAEGLRARVRRRYRCTTQSDLSLPVAPNLLARNFTRRGARHLLGRGYDRVPPRGRRPALSGGDPRFVLAVRRRVGGESGE
jgi:putative transposase